MGQGAEQEELVGFGDERERPPRSGIARRLTRPWLVAAVVLAVLVAGVGIWLAGERGAAPDPPTVAVADDETAVDPTSLSEPLPWTVGDDGRPTAAPVLRRALELTFSRSPELERIEVYGVAGPGLDVPDRPVRWLSGTTRVTTFPVEQELDCEQVPFPVPREAYGLAVRVVAEARSTRATVGAGESGPVWADAVQKACASWLARTHLTVTKAVVSADPSRPRARLNLTLTNDGEDDAFLAPIAPEGGGDLDVSSVPAGPIRVPAGGAAQVQADVRIEACDTVAAIRTVGNGTDVPVAVTSDVVDLYAIAGPASGLASKQPTWTTGFGPTGVVLSADAALEVSEVLRAACGGVEGFAVLVAPDGASYDPRTRVLSVRLFVDGTPRTIKDVQLVRMAGDYGQNSFTLLTRKTERLVPDRTGQVVTTLRYRVPRSDACPSPNLLLPGFGLVVRTPPSTGSRTVRFTHFTVQWDGTVVRAEICPDTD